MDIRDPIGENIQEGIVVERRSTSLKVGSNENPSNLAEFSRGGRESHGLI